MRFAVVGAGGVGGYFGARLAEAGHRVSFVARGAHLEAMRAGGLRVASPAGDVLVADPDATDDPRRIGVVDVVLVAVKAWQLAAAAAAMRPLVGPDTAVIPLLNGVEAPERLAAALGAPAVLGGVCGILAHIEAPGRIRHLGADPFIGLGELDDTPSARVESIRRALGRARGMRAEVPADVVAAMWQKFLFIAPTSGIGALADAPVGVLRAQPETRALIERAMAEVLEVARARGVALPGDAMARALGLLDAAPADGLASMHRDIAAGRPSELDDQPGAVVRMAAAAGVDVPVNTCVYHSLLPRERRARGALRF